MSADIISSKDKIFSKVKFQLWLLRKRSTKNELPAIRQRIAELLTWWDSGVEERRK